MTQLNAQGCVIEASPSWLAVEELCAECVFQAICVITTSREETGSVDGEVGARGLAKIGGSDSVVKE